MKARFIFQVILFVFPWKLRKYILCNFLHFEIGDGAHIGFSIILARKVKIGNNTTIGHLNIFKPIDEFIIGKNSNMGNRNFITGFSVSDPAVLLHGHFGHIENRKCVLVIGDETGITSRHYFDCNGGIYIGNFCQIAGFETCFMTHSIDLKYNRQDAQPIKVNDYSFIGTRCTLIKGSNVPEKSVVGACSLVNKVYIESGLYGGVPARFIKKNEDYQFFQRTNGFVK